MLLALSDSWLSLNELHWALNANKRTAARIAKASWSLRRQGLIESEHRTLSSFDEVRHVFPFKTYDRAVRAVRETFLPVLAGYRPSREMRYSRGRNEEHLLRNHEGLPAFVERWQRLEPELLRATLISEPSASDLVLPIVWRARQLLGIDAHVKDDRSLHVLTDTAIREWTGKPLPCLEEVRLLCVDLFPQSASIALRSLLHELIDMSKGGVAELRLEVRAFLLQRAREQLVAMSGHREASMKRRRYANPSSITVAENTQFDPLLLHQVLTRKALERYWFLRLTATGAEKRTMLIKSSLHLS